MSKDEMRKEYDFSGGVRGKHYGKVKGTRVIKAANPSKPAKEKEDLDEAVSLLLRVRPHLEGMQSAEKLKERIKQFLDRVIA